MKEEKNKNYRVIKIKIKEGKYPEIFSMFKKASLVSTEIYNKALYVLRQNYTAHQKPEEEWSENEKDIHSKLITIEEMFDKNGELPWVIDHMKMYYFLRKYEAYFTEYKGQFPYSVLRAPYMLACQDFKSWQKGQKSYFKDPSKFKKRPKMPNYKEQGSASSFSINDMRDTLKVKNGKCFLKIPNCKEVIELSNYFEDIGKLKGIEIEFVDATTFLIRLLVEETKEYQQVNPLYHAGIDLGINNAMTFVSNCKQNESLIFNGKVLKTINQWYNKQYAKLAHENMNGHNMKDVVNTKTKRMERLTQKRNNCINDQIHKMSKAMIDYCLKNDIGTIVIGENKEWKQEAKIGKRNTQNFVQIPFEKLKSNIEYRAKRHGITVIRRDEAYSSKADYLSNDYMPNKYEKDFKGQYSGRRVMRGLYKSGIGERINADCNGAANILRKEFPDIVIPLANLQNVRKIKKFI